MATNKRGWHVPTVTLPRIRFGSGREREDSPVATYYLVVIPALLLSVFGLVMGFSAQTVTAIAQGENPYTAYSRPLLIILVSLLIATFVQLVPQRWFVRLAPLIFGAALVFQGLVLSPLGRSEGGNANWVKIGPVMAQPSELLKLALVVFLAFMVSKSASKRSDIKTMGVAVGLPLVVALGAVMLGRDMGTAMVVAMGALGAAWVAGLPKRWFGGLLMVAIPTLVLLVLSNPTRIRRILAVLPGTSKGPDESAPEQIDHSLWALGSGGLTGLGPGASREKWNYLQAAHTDFIFAIASIPDVEVFPCAPATAMKRIPEAASARAWERWMTSCPRPRATASSGLSSRMALDTTTTASGSTWEASCPTSTRTPTERR